MRWRFVRPRRMAWFLLGLTASAAVGMLVFVALIGETEAESRQRAAYDLVAGASLEETTRAFATLHGVSEADELSELALSALERVTDAAETLAQAEPPSDAQKPHAQMVSAFQSLQATLRRLGRLPDGTGLRAIADELLALEPSLNTLRSASEQLEERGYLEDEDA